MLNLDQPQIRFIDQRRRLQRVPGAFASHIVSGQTMQFGMNQRDQLLQRRLVAIAPSQQQLRDFV
jgi:hypothetical protein